MWVRPWFHFTVRSCIIRCIMPEIVSKYPEVVLKVLKRSGVECGTGKPQKILKACPAERFCSLPGGELCVYGTDEISEMTQIKMDDLVAVSESSYFSTEAIGLAGVVLVIGLVVGLVVGRWMKKE